ncbi:MAG: ABC transporter permease [Alphaproteobacteria bacterium]|nr:ABC transporter permease [Alphaproteobacteria bacterium]
MHRYILRRLAETLPTLLIVSLIVFLLAHLAPGDPAARMLGSYATSAEIAKAREEMGFDRSVVVQYAAWLVRAVQGDLGRSINSGLPVLETIADRLPRTFSLALLSLLVSILIGVPLGILAAIRQNTIWDQASMSFCLIGLSIPDFVAGLLLVLVFSVELNLLPSIGYAPLAQGFGDWLGHLAMPSFSLGFLMSAVTARMTRSSVLDVLRQDYVLTARAKGMSETRVVGIHVLKSAMIPVLTVIGINLGAVFRGAVVIETLFALPGIGRLMITGIEFRDYPVIQGCLLSIVTIYILINLIVDLLYAWLDPRIRYT